MSVENKINLLRENLKNQIKSFSRKRTLNKRKATAFKIAASGLAAITTILLGLQNLNPTWLIAVKNIALVISAVLTFLAALDAFFNHRALWIRYTATLVQLNGIRTDLEYALSDGLDRVKEKDIDRIHEKFMSVLESTNTYWLQLRQEDISHDDEA